MDLRGLDLNLLVVLEALLEEAHVSRAAARVGLSQSATSSALERCRHLFGDRLLERRGAGMRLTPAAEALRAPLAVVLNDLKRLLNLREPDITTVRRTVRLVMADALAAVFSAPLRRRLAETAPGIDLVLQPWGAGARAEEALRKGEVDLAVSLLPETDTGDVRRETFLRQDYRIAFRADHPAAADFDLETWLAFPHLVVSASGGAQTSLDAQLEALGLQRRVAVVLPSFLLAPDLLRGSELIALLPSLCLHGRAGEGLTSLEPPVTVEPFTLYLGWARRRERDAVVSHVASVLRTLRDELVSTGADQADPQTFDVDSGI